MVIAKERVVTIIRICIRCPRCRFQVELDELGRRVCAFCDYEIDINRVS